MFIQFEIIKDTLVILSVEYLCYGSPAIKNILIL